MLAAAVGNPEHYKFCESLFPCGTPMESKAGLDLIRPSSKDEAKKMLKEAGYKGDKLVILQPTDIPISSAFAQVAAKTLRDIGMNVDLQAMDWSSVTSRRAKKDPVDKGGWSLIHSQWSALDLLSPVINPNLDARGEIGYIGWSKSEQMESLRDQFAVESDRAKKMAIVKEIQKLNYDQVFYVPLGGFSKFKGYTARMANMVEAPLPLFWQAKR
jgi:peptide/nickel transport system substrate-binding protein